MSIILYSYRIRYQLYENITENITSRLSALDDYFDNEQDQQEVLNPDHPVNPVKELRLIKVIRPFYWTKHYLRLLCG